VTGQELLDPISATEIPTAPVSRARFPVWILAAFGVVAGASFLVGWLAAPEEHRFDWELASIFGTGLGTTLLAGATFALARATDRDVQATQLLARQGRRREELEQRPKVMVTEFNYHPLNHEEHQELIRQLGGNPRNAVLHGWNDQLEVVLFNFGQGTAVDIRLTATYADAVHQPEVEEVRRPVIRGGGTDRFIIRVNFVNLPEVIEARCFALEGSYADQTGRNRYRLITEWAQPTLRRA